MDDDIVVAALVVAKVVLAPAKHHEVRRVVEVLGAVIVVNGPHTVVP